MRITVSSTSMMQPMFESQPDLTINAVPSKRACGMLEPALSNDRAEFNYPDCKQAFYLQPNTKIAAVLTSGWDNVQTIASRYECVNYVVFGFYYDGQCDWVRVWIKTQQRYLWTQRQDNMTYRSYAVVTMDALSKIPPIWDGQLHASPFQSLRTAPSTQNSERTSHVPNATSKNTIATVADAAANERGDLWFLVTINSSLISRAHCLQQPARRSGWIRANSVP